MAQDIDPAAVSIATRLLIGGLRSFKVIYTDTNKKHVTIACYDKRHVCAYLQPFSHYTR